MVKSITHEPKAGPLLTGTEYEDEEHIVSGVADEVHAHAGEDITSGTVADARIAATIARDTEVTSAVGAEATARDAAIEVHRADTTNVHGIADTANLSAVGHSHAGEDITSGTVADARVAAALARDSEVTSAISTHAGATDPHGDRADAASQVATHSADTTAVHGIADTANVVLTGDARLSDARTPTAHKTSHEDGGADEISLTGLSGTPAALTTHEGAADPHPGYLTPAEGNAAYSAIGAYAPGSTDVAVADGGTGASTATNARTNLGVVIGTDVRAQGSGDPTRASLGLATSDSPEFAAINVGAATDTTITRTGAGDVAVEGNALYRAGGTDVPVADGGTGASTASGARTALEAYPLPWTRGTSMPGSPVTGQRITRTDQNKDFEWNGTRWLCTCPHRDTFGVATQGNPITATNNVGFLTPWAGVFDLWLVAFYTTTYVLTTNNGTDFWTIACRKQDAAGTPTTIVSFTTAAHTASNWTKVRTAIGAVYTDSTHRIIDTTATKSASAGSLYCTSSLEYHLIGV